jgi:protein-arginine kinase activator protein McsA
MAFKIHMILLSDQEGFTTVCGIDDGCSDKFKDTAEFSNGIAYPRKTMTFSDFGDERKTTCKKCLQRFTRMLTSHDIEVAELSHSA